MRGGFGDADILMNEILILGLIILVGFIGRIFFKYTKIPESLFMIIIGLTVGPLLGIVDQDLFLGYESLIVIITLIIVLLDTGLNLNIFETIRSLLKATGFTLLVLIISILSVGGFFIFVIGWPPLPALLLGVVSSGTTTVVTGYLLPRLSVPEGIKQILIMESIINDVTLIAGAIIIVQLIGIGTFNLTQIASLLVRPLLIAVIFGLTFTFLWVTFLWRLYKAKELTYVFTIGILFSLYSLVELTGGNGAIAVLVLTLSLGNLPLILDTFLGHGFLKRYNPQSLKERFNEILNGLKGSQVDFAFFIQNFFFVYLGITFDTKKLNFTLIGLCFTILLLMFISRYISARIVGLVDSDFKRYSTFIAGMVARGFTATFVALLPSTKGIELPLFKEIVLIMVLFSILITITRSIIHERRLTRY